MRQIGMSAAYTLLAAAAAASGCTIIGYDPGSARGDMTAVAEHRSSGDVLIMDEAGVGSPLLPARRPVADLGTRRRRSRGPQAKPARKPNRRTIGRRVRRKHRRAA